jgi:GT2 family glycosyltransferase
MGDTRATSSHPRLATVIVPCWNQLEFTRQCITALVRSTRRPWELIVVNNGSTDGTREYLAGVQDAAAVPVTVIANSTNVGFPAAINQGLVQARGEYLILLNNDAVVTEGWLEQLIALTRAVPKEAEAGETCGPADGGVGRPAPNSAALEATDGAGSTPPGRHANESTDGAGCTPPGPPLQRCIPHTSLPLERTSSF